LQLTNIVKIFENITFQLSYTFFKQVENNFIIIHLCIQK